VPFKPWILYFGFCFGRYPTESILLDTRGFAQAGTYGSVYHSADLPLPIPVETLFNGFVHDGSSESDSHLLTLQENLGLNAEVLLQSKSWLYFS